MHGDYRLSAWILIGRWSAEMIGLTGYRLTPLAEGKPANYKLLVSSNNSHGTKASVFLLV